MTAPDPAHAGTALHDQEIAEAITEGERRERTRILALAHQVGAYYQGDCEDELCGNPHHVIRHFADLLQAQP